MTKTFERLRILLADDHALLREALNRVASELLPSATLFEAESLEQALEIADREAPIDLALLDIRMPGMDGVAGVKIFRERFPDVRVAILSGYFARTDVVEALENGALGFIPKSLELEKVFEAIQIILAGHTYVPASIVLAARGRNRIPSEAPIDHGESLDSFGLTRRERDVLLCLAKGHPNKEIAQRLGLQEITVKLHLRNIYRKLGVRNRAQAVRVVLQNGRMSDVAC